MVDEPTLQQQEAIIRSLYVPARTRFARGVDPDRCRHAVLSPWNRTGSAVQCSRKAYIFIGGYGFCQQHAQRIMARVLPPDEAA